MQVVNLWLSQVLAHAAGFIEPRVGLFGSADAGGTGAHDDANSMGANVVRQRVYCTEDVVLLQAKPGQLVIAALQVDQSLGKLDVLDTRYPANPCVQIAALEIILP